MSTVMKRKTVADLEREVKDLEPYREAYFCLMKGLVPVQVRNCGVFVTVVGMNRASGGVLIGIDGVDCVVQYVSNITAEWAQGRDPHLRDIARQLNKLAQRSA